MVHSLEEAKRVVSQNYLRRDGIHGVGMLPDEGVVTVYVLPTPSARRDRTLLEIDEKVKPYKVQVIRSPMATLAEQ